MIALPLKSTRLRKSRNQPLAFKPDVTLTIAFESMAFVALRQRDPFPSRRKGGSAAPVASFDFAAPFQFCFVREGKRFRRRIMPGRTIAKD
jgi:hypothetical protein